MAHWSSTEISMMVMSVSAALVSILVVIQKSRCTKITCPCGTECERDVSVAEPPTDLESARSTGLSPPASVVSEGGSVSSHQHRPSSPR